MPLIITCCRSFSVQYNIVDLKQMHNSVLTNFSVNQTFHVQNSTLYPTRSQEQLGNGRIQLNAWTIAQILAFHAMLLLSLIGNMSAIKAVIGDMKTSLEDFWLMNFYSNANEARR